MKTPKLSGQDFERLYTSGEYAGRHPDWHSKDSPWKARQVCRILNRNNLSPQKVVEVGCGAGEILRQLQRSLPKGVDFVGYDISPQAFSLAQERAGPRLTFHLADFIESEETEIDVLLVIDVIEHLEDHFTFLRRIRSRAQYKVFHIPLDLSVEWLARNSPILNERRTVGHLHYFTKDIALELLGDTGHEVVDWFYTPWGIDLYYPSWQAVRQSDAPVKRGLRKATQHALRALNPDLAARLTRGWSLAVLAR
jgi:SAM-dependent methyltransferase